MILSTVIKGIEVVASISNILNVARQQCHHAELTSQMVKINSLLNDIKTEISSLNPSRKATPVVLDKYNVLVKFLRESDYYREYIEFHPTRSRTWRLVRKRKKTILRDPQGEYSTETDSPIDTLIEVDGSGNVHSIKSYGNSLMPGYPMACRCKDHIDIRETISLVIVKGLLKNHRSRNPQKPFRWLDLCCGRGTILNHFDSALNDFITGLEYWGVDAEPRHIEACKKIIRKKKLYHNFKFRNHDVTRVLAQSDGQFNFITLLNVLHEIPPKDLFDVLIAAIDRCKPTGQLLIIDMEELPHLEWKAITWSKDSMTKLFTPFLKNKENIGHSKHQAFCASSYHRTVDVAVIEIYKKSLDLNKLKKNKSALKEQFNTNLKVLLSEMQRSISEFMIDEFEKANDSDGKTKDSVNPLLRNMLWKYWAVTEALQEME